VDNNTIRVLSHNACETKFEYRGEVLRLWIITGGTPALDLDEYFEAKRYPHVELYDSKNWCSGVCRYRHQEHTPRGEVLPIVDVDVLPDGIETVNAYLDYVLPRRAVQRARLATLPKMRVIKSRRVHDTYNRTYVWARVEMNKYGVSPVTFDSAYYCGRCEGDTRMLNRFGNVWINAVRVLNPIFDRNDGTTSWADMSEDEFTLVHDTLWTLANLKR
jgi:hypothetical protein